MRTRLALTGLLFLLASPASAEIRAPLFGYHGESDYIPQTPSVSGGAVGAFANPASWATAEGGEAAFWWNDRSLREDELDNWGFSFGKNLGFAMQKNVFADEEGTFGLHDFQLGLAGGDRRSYFGAAYRWAGEEAGRVGRENAVVLGTIQRPNRYLDFGLSGAFATRSDRRLGIADLGLRPFGKPWVTLFGEYSLADSDRLEDGFWGGGFETRPWSGIHLGMKFLESEEGDPTYSVNVGLTFDHGFHVLPSYDQNDDLRSTTYLYRFNPPYRGIPLREMLERRLAKNRYEVVDLENKQLTYQKAGWFDDDKAAWLDLARRLDRIREDGAVRGVAVNMAGLRFSSSIGWELRRKLEELRGAGKEVIVHIDRMGLGYYVASAADRLSIDPQGDILFPGVAVHRTYMRGLLDKVGIGIEEWRYFTHKSAMESLSRKEMSDADREQLGRLADVVYETTRSAICASRDILTADFDALVDEQAWFTAERAYEKGLVDTIARWDALGDWLKEHREGARLGGSPLSRAERIYADEPWGRPPEIAVVYAIGECAMDNGIRGRATSKHMRALAKDRDVAAVVLRADSPGGDPLPSDLVAEATRKIKEEEKPVVVSQGSVAASGGYWISMDGTKILTTPLTITGSIGVIGGWLWDAGVGEKTGFSADGVQRGRRSDLFTGIRFPMVGTLPTRNLTDEERGTIRDRFLELYGGFVRKVAAGRGIAEDDVRTIGEGRIWMGEDAIQRKLADEVGGLTDAIAEAKRLAGIEPDAEVILTEFPKRPRFNLPKIGGSPFARLLSPFLASGAGAPAHGEGEGSYDLYYLRALAEAKGSPLVALPPEAIPEGWESVE
ncbi:MAG: S49 family peptidase [Candidatus Latescibacterota bacterium]|nr:MAG: S49 family peptidase [Candidatus Latescibacterota bacterium]